MGRSRLFGTVVQDNMLHNFTKKDHSSKNITAHQITFYVNKKVLSKSQY